MRKKLLAILYIILISIFMYISAIRRPTAYISNEEAQEDILELKGNECIIQELQINHDDRNIQEIGIKFDGKLKETEEIIVTLSADTIEEIEHVTETDIGEDGWYSLEYNFEGGGRKKYF